MLLFPYCQHSCAGAQLGTEQWGDQDDRGIRTSPLCWHPGHWGCHLPSQGNKLSYIHISPSKMLECFMFVSQEGQTRIGSNSSSPKADIGLCNIVVPFPTLSHSFSGPKLCKSLRMIHKWCAKPSWMLQYFQLLLFHLCSLGSWGYSAWALRGWVHWWSGGFACMWWEVLCEPCGGNTAEQDFSWYVGGWVTCNL